MDSKAHKDLMANAPSPVRACRVLHAPRNRNRNSACGIQAIVKSQKPGYAGVRRECGMTLLEMLAYVAVLGILLNIAAGALMMCSRLSVKGTTAVDRANAIEEVRTEFTETVRAASAVRAGVCDYRTGPDQVVLEMPPGPDEPQARHYTVLGFLGTESRMSRLRIKEQDGNFSAEGLDTYRLPIESLKLSYDASEPANAHLVTIEVDVKDDRPIRGEPVLHRFSAAPRGIGKGGASS